MLFFGTFYGCFMASTYKTISDLDDEILTVAGAMGSIANGTSRFLWGCLQDRFGFIRVYIVVMIIQSFCSAFLFTFKDSGYFYVAMIAFSYSCEGG